MQAAITQFEDGQLLAFVFWTQAHIWLFALRRASRAIPYAWVSGPSSRSQLRPPVRMLLDFVVFPEVSEVILIYSKYPEQIWSYFSKLHRGAVFLCDVWKPNTLQLAPATTQSCDVSTVFHSVDSISLRDQSCRVSSIYSLRLLSSDKINEDHFKVIYFQDCMSTDTLEKYLYTTENHRSITHNSLDYFTTR